MTGAKQGVLIVSFSYAPMFNPRAFRWTALAERWAAAGQCIDVVTSLQPGEPEYETRNGVRVHRVGLRWAEGLRKRVSDRRKAVAGARAGVASVRAPSTGGRLAQFLAEQVWRRLHWPDATCLWYPPARAKTLELLARGASRTLISVAPSFTAVLAGTPAKRAYPSLRWMLDLGDPFSFLEEAPPNNRALYRGLNRRVERRVFGDADVVSVTNDATRARYAGLFPESAAKIHVVPPLISGEFASRGERPPDGTLRLLYVGTLYRGVREPDWLLELAAQLEVPGRCVELHFVGDVTSCAASLERYRARFGERLAVHGMVSREAVARAMQEADVLVNIGNDTPFQLPSKVVEYAATGKPIVNLARTAEDSSMRFFEGRPGVLNLLAVGVAPSPEQRAEFRAFVARRHPLPGAAQIEAFLSPYRIEAVAARYLELLGAEAGG